MPKTPTVVEKAVEKSFCTLSDSDLNPCQNDFVPCKGNLDPCKPPHTKPSIFSISHHFSYIR